MLSEAQIERYARHILLREVGGLGQERLLAASVRIEGLGPVGSWACTYLALAGVGAIELWDPRPVPAEGLLPLLPPDATGRRDEAIARRIPAHNPDVRATVGASGEAPIADEACLRVSGLASARLWAKAAGTEVAIGWSERPPCVRCFPGVPPTPETAALAGSLAASRMLGRILFGDAAPGIVRIRDGAEEVLPPCDHR